MTIQTEIKKEDWNAYVQFIRNQFKKDGSKNTMTWVLAACFGAAIGFGATIAKISLDFLSLIIGSFGTALWIIVLSRSKLKKMKEVMQPSEDGIILGHCSVNIEEEGIRTVIPSCETFYRWPTVRRTEVTDKHIFIVVDNIAAITVPRRAFGSADEEEKFLSKIHQHVRS